MRTQSAALPQGNKAVVQRAFDNWAAGRCGGVFDLLADDASWTIVGDTPVPATVVPRVRGLYADGNTVIAYFDTATPGTDGRAETTANTWYLTLENNQVVSVIAFGIPNHAPLPGVSRALNAQGRRPFYWASLTDAERRVAELASHGYSNREIAAEVFLSRHTVGSHLRHIFTKLDVRSRVELTRVVIEQSNAPLRAAS
jgi:DNA-binding CsgD family transcriptional regulator/ketosteroid isomerase-like protein